VFIAYETSSFESQSRGSFARQSRGGALAALTSLMALSERVCKAFNTSSFASPSRGVPLLQ